MDYLVVCGVALLVSGLTFIAGFGLGTMLMPAFALFFPLPLAIAATALVHLANNIFKLGLIGKKADLSVVLKFGIPGFFFALLGAALLNILNTQDVLFSYALSQKTYDVTFIELIIGLLIVFFALMDLLPVLSRIQVPKRFISLGGALSGFFGGLSGHQGALRTTFLIKFGLEKEAFIATGIVVAVLVDIGRIFVYGVSMVNEIDWNADKHLFNLIIFSSIFAFAGAIAGRMLLKKITFRSIQLLVGSLLIVLGFSLVFGLL